MPDVERRRTVYATTLVVGVVWFVLDQATKVAAVRALEGQVPNDLGPLILRVIRNSGGAFSLPIRLPWLFVVVAIVVTYLVIKALPDTKSVWLAGAYGLVVGGAIGNGVDRIFRDGAVVDMIDLDFAPLTNFPVFNVADIGITVGAAMVALLMVRDERQQAKAAGPAVIEPLGEGDERAVVDGVADDGMADLVGEVDTVPAPPAAADDTTVDPVPAPPGSGE